MPTESITSVSGDASTFTRLSVSTYPTESVSSTTSDTGASTVLAVSAYPTEYPTESITSVTSDATVSTVLTVSAYPTESIPSTTSDASASVLISVQQVTYPAESISSVTSDTVVSTSLSVSTVYSTEPIRGITSDASSLSVLEVTGAPLFRITKYPSSISAKPGSTFSISVTIANTGSVDGTVEVRVRDHTNNVVSSKQVYLAAGAEVSVTLSATAPSTAGTYTWKIEAYNTNTGTVDDTKTFTLSVTGVALPSWLSDWRIWLIILLLVLVLLASRRRRGE